MRIAPKLKSNVIKPSYQSMSDKRPDLFKNLPLIKTLFDEASLVQRNVAVKVHDNKAFNVDEIEDVTKKLVNAVLECDQALWFMTRIRRQDAYLLEHSLNVGILLGLFSKYLGFEASIIHDLLLGGFLHDIGKLMIPQKILNKKGTLTDEEYEIVKGHVVLSKQIIEHQFKSISPISLITLTCHHEKFNGTGYPGSLKSDEIPFFGKMIAIVDTFDALTAKRCYKQEMPNIEALRVLIKESGKSFDPYLTAQFVKFIGTYPPGTLVLIATEYAERLAIIMEVHPTNPLTPKVKSFYNTKSKNYIEVAEVNLASTNCAYRIEKAVTPEQYHIDMIKLMDICF